MFKKSRSVAFSPGAFSFSLFWEEGEGTLYLLINFPTIIQDKVKKTKITYTNTDGQVLWNSMI